MNAASIKEIKDELNNLKSNELIEICLKLAKFKKENKELISYLLFNSDDEEGYIKSVKTEIENQFKLVNKKNIFYAKKSIRKALRIANKYIKYSEKKSTEVEILIYFCKLLTATEISFKKYPVIYNLYNRQLLRIEKSLASLHEDLQYDYRIELRGLMSNQNMKTFKWL